MGVLKTGKGFWIKINLKTKFRIIILEIFFSLSAAEFEIQCFDYDLVWRIGKTHPQ